MATTQDAFGPLSVIRDATSGVVLAVVNKERDLAIGPDARYTSAQLSALAAAGGLTPNATYVASDTGARRRATSTRTLARDSANPASRLRVAFVGDSFVAIGATFGYTTTLGVAIGGIAVAPVASQNTPTGGTGTITFDGVRYATFAAYGETAGAAVDISGGGNFEVYSSGGSYLTVPSTPRAFTGSPVSTTVTLGTLTSVRGSASFPHLIDALVGGGCEIKRFGISGDQSTDITLRAQYVLDWQPDVIFDMYGANDIVAAALSSTQAAANRIANWDLWSAAEVPIIASTMAARWAAGDAAVRTNTLQANLVRTNALLQKEAAGRSDVVLVDWYSRNVDTASATGAAIAAYMSADGIHPGAGASYAIARPMAEQLLRMFPRQEVAVPVGANAGYDATLYPTGQLLTGGQGSFVGTGGSASTGAATAAAWSASVYTAGSVCLNTTLGAAYWTPNGGTAAGSAPSHTAGTVADGGGVLWTFITLGASVGFAANWTATRSTGASALGWLYKVADPAGGTPWQELFVANLTPEVHTFWLRPATLVMGNISTGDTLQSYLEVDIEGAICQGLHTDVSVSGGIAGGTTWGSAQQASSIPQGIQGRLCIACEPVVVPASTTALQPRIFLKGGDAVTQSVWRARLRNYCWRKVI